MVAAGIASSWTLPLADGDYRWRTRRQEGANWFEDAQRFELSLPLWFRAVDCRVAQCLYGTVLSSELPDVTLIADGPKA